MIGNDRLSLRQFYSAVLDNHAAGWTTSFMSGMPSDVESIAGGFDLVICELGRPDTSDRVDMARRLRRAGVDVVTHVEGQESERLRAELVGDGVVVVANPFHADQVAAALEQVATRRKAAPRVAGARERLRRFLGR